MRFFGGLFPRNKPLVGIEVDAQEIRAVELTPDGGGFQVAASAVLPGPELGPSGVPDENGLAAALTDLFGKAGFSTRQAVSALPGTAVIERLVHIPPMPAREVAGAVRFEAGQLIPVSLDDMCFAHVVLGEAAGQKRRLTVLVAAAPRDLVYRFHQAFSDAGLTLAAVDLPALALWRVFCGLDQSVCSGRQVLINVGLAATHCVVVEKGRPLFIRTSSVGIGTVPAAPVGSNYVIGRQENTFGRALHMTTYLPGGPIPGVAASRGTGRNDIDHEKMTYVLSTELYGINEPPAVYDIGKKIKEPDAGRLEFNKDPGIRLPGRVDGLIREIKSSLEFFQGLHDEPVEKLVLTGPAAAWPHLAGIFSRELEMEVVVGRPVFLSPPEPDETTDDFNPVLTVATGLSLWGVGK